MYVCKPGDRVAAIVKNSSTPPAGGAGGSGKRGKSAEEESEEENWILAEVVSFNSTTYKYEVDDVDAVWYWPGTRALAPDTATVMSYVDAVYANTPM